MFSPKDDAFTNLTSTPAKLRIQGSRSDGISVYTSSRNGRESCEVGEADKVSARNSYAPASNATGADQSEFADWTITSTRLTSVRGN